MWGTLTFGCILKGSKVPPPPPLHPHNPCSLAMAPAHPLLACFGNVRLLLSMHARASSVPTTPLQVTHPQHCRHCDYYKVHLTQFWLVSSFKQYHKLRMRALTMLGSLGSSSEARLIYPPPPPPPPLPPPLYMSLRLL